MPVGRESSTLVMVGGERTVKSLPKESFADRLYHILLATLHLSLLDEVQFRPCPIHSSNLSSSAGVLKLHSGGYSGGISCHGNNLWPHNWGTG